MPELIPSPKPTIPEQVAKAVADRSAHELALGWLRYEKLRRLGPRAYTDLCQANLRGRESFDDLVDKLDL